MNGQIKSIPLDQIVKLIPGAPKAAYLADQSEGFTSMHLLKGSNIDHQGGIITSDMDQVSLCSGKNVERYILQTDDVVLLARGSAIRAALVKPEDHVHGIIASANFIIIRPEPNTLQSEALVAYLNSTIGQKKLANMCVGAAINHIPTTSLRAMQVTVPSVEDQHQIRELFHAGRDAYKSTVNLAEQYKRTTTAAILDLMAEGA
jgi:restriction endonuclease S subunit